MKLEEKISQHFNCPFVYSSKHKMYVCSNGVSFTKEEYDTHKDDPEWLEDEYQIRSRLEYGKIDYNLLKEKDKLSTVEGIQIEPRVKVEPNTNLDEVKCIGTYRVSEPKQRTQLSVSLICFALGLVSIVSMYISTVHTATYLFDYVDVLSAWLMSAVITIYSSTAFEVVILFHERHRHILSVIFAVLWSLVITFSMVTTVSVFYDRFNFTTLENAEENKAEDGSRLALEVLQKQEASLKEDIQFKRNEINEKQKEIEYRQANEWATSTYQSQKDALSLQLNELQSKLQSNLEQQQEIVMETPNATKEASEVHRKETLFAFLGRIMGIEGGILEFIMSTLSAIFVNLISPLSLSVVVSLKGGKE